MSDRPGATIIPISPVDVVGLGLNAMDYVTVVPHFPAPRSKVQISQIRLQPGGQVATALVTCRRMGLSVRYLGSVGSDELGRAQLTSLRSEGIETDCVRVVDGAATQMALAIVEEGVGERTILWHRDPRLVFPPSEVSPEVIASGRLLHLDGRDSLAALRAAGIARSHRIPVMVDIDKRYDETTEELLAQVDYLIAAEAFALELTGATDVCEAALALAERFPRGLIGITTGGAGAVFVRNGRAVRSPAFQVEVRDTTGAGDVFHGAMIFGILEGWEIDATIRFAHGAAAMACRELGARTGIPGANTVRKFLETARETDTG